jgi:membrane protein YdbS with pleckstrin-like domain
MKPISKSRLELFSLTGSEQPIGEAHRHLIGSVYIFANGLFVSLVLLALLYYIVSNEGQFFSFFKINYTWPLTQVASLLIGLMITVVVIITALAIAIYRRDYLALTSHRVVFFKSLGLIKRKLSQLNLADVQDVTVYQNNLLSRMFDFGTVVVETAGEQSNLIMKQVSKPYDVSKRIIEAHEKHVERYQT